MTITKCYRSFYDVSLTHVYRFWNVFPFTADDGASLALSFFGLALLKTQFSINICM